MTKTLWSGRQWRVTTEGLEEVGASSQPYWIDIADLWRGGGDAGGGLLAHMADKPWVDLEEFVTAFLIACVTHGVAIANVGEQIEAARQRRRDASKPLGLGA